MASDNGGGVSSPHRGRRLGGRGRGARKNHNAAPAPPPDPEEYEKMWKGTAVKDTNAGGGAKLGGGVLEDSFVKGLWGSAGDPTAGLSSLAIEKDTATAAGSGDVKGDVPSPTLTTPVWKRRAGLGGKLAVAARREWERRRLELVGTTLRYYCIDPEDEEEDAGGTMAALAEDGDAEGGDGTASENRTPVSALAPPSAPSSGRSTPMTPSQKKKQPPPASPSWVPHVSFGSNSEDDPSSPRGELDLSNEEFTVDLVSEDDDSEKQKHLPTTHVMRILRKGDHVHWKICLDSREALDEWAEVLQSALGEERVEVSASSPGQQHVFQPGDHVIRWEVMVIPVGYPIQIHGIVLEAGRNCVIIADFGLTSYGKKEKDGVESDMAYDVSTSDEDKEHHSVVMDHWKKLRPNQLQRLNVIAYTDEKEIRKWKKVNYGKTGEATPTSGRRKKFGLFRKKSGDQGDALAASPSPSHRKGIAGTTVSHEDSGLEERISGAEEWIEEGDFAGVSQKHESDKGAPDDATATAAPAKEGRIVAEEGPKTSRSFNEPAWFDGRESESNRPRVFSLDTPTSEHESSSAEKKAEQDAPKLPKSDPAKIVLARTNFLLERGDEVLPPYHVFHSNSECIAVWCKTGRWSTLQTSIFLASCTIGNTKSAAVMSMGVAAAHVFLLPVAAVGGIAFATAPMLILKKSKEKWEAATMYLTDKFWEWAPPEVYVEAIRHWSSLR